MTASPESTALPVAGARETWHELWPATRGHRRRLAAVAVLGLSSAALGLITPAAIGRLVDLVETRTAGVGTVVALAAAMVVASAASATGTALTTVLAARTYQTIVADLRERLVAKAMNLQQRVVERAGTGDLIARASDDVAQIADAAPQLVPAVTRASFTIIVTFAGTAVLDWRYGAALAIVLPVYALTVRWYLATAPGIYRAERAAMSSRAQQILESLRGVQTVLGFGLTERRHRAVVDASWAVAEPGLRARTVVNMFFGRLSIAEYLGMSAILISGFFLIGAGQSTLGAATTAMLFFLRLFGPINQLLFVVDVLQSVIASLNRMVGVITMDAAARPPGNGSTGSDAVRLRGVTFRYDTGPAALDDVDLTIAAGERVAVVGASGAGKTTLAGVISGVHVPRSGTVVRPPNTAVITQDAHVFAGTLRDNLTLSAPDATDEDLVAALEVTRASALLDLLPNGLDTRLGAAGHTLTAAQAQQVALARVVLADPELAIFDEATAEAGSAHAELLDHAADAALRGRTGLVIAHRLSQAAACDRIVVMDHGRIIEDGTHDALVAAGSVYARLWESWNGSREPSRDDR